MKARATDAGRDVLAAAVARAPFMPGPVRSMRELPLLRQNVGAWQEGMVGTAAAERASTRIANQLRDREVAIGAARERIPEFRAWLDAYTVELESSSGEMVRLASETKGLALEAMLDYQLVESTADLLGMLQSGANVIAAGDYAAMSKSGQDVSEVEAATKLIHAIVRRELLEREMDPDAYLRPARVMVFDGSLQRAAWRQANVGT